MALYKHTNNKSIRMWWHFSSLIAPELTLELMKPKAKIVSGLPSIPAVTGTQEFWSSEVHLEVLESQML